MELAVAAFAYFLPTIIAAARGHHNGGAVFALNLLLGWTVLGWIAALVWAVTAVRKDLKRPSIMQELQAEIAKKNAAESSATPAEMPAEAPADDLEALRAEGRISEEEYQALRASRRKTPR